jgi:Protein of unknown function (DUF2490)
LTFVLRPADFFIHFDFIRSLPMLRICSAYWILLLLIFPAISGAQTTNQFSGWLAAFGRVELKNQFSLHIESQLRSTDNLEQIQSVLLRVGLNYNLKKNQIFTIGYAYISSRRTADGVTGYGPEDRIWEQFVLNEAFSVQTHGISIQNRFRLEQRFIGQSVVEDGQLETSGFSFVQRIRYFARMIVPFAKTSAGFNKGAFFSLQDEVFVNIGDLSVVNGKYFDQNRAYFSIGYRFSPKNDTEIGYMNQYVLNKGMARTSNNILQIATYIKL